MKNSISRGCSLLSVIVGIAAIVTSASGQDVLKRDSSSAGAQTDTKKSGDDNAASNEFSLKDVPIVGNLFDNSADKDWDTVLSTEPITIQDSTGKTSTVFQVGRGIPDTRVSPNIRNESIRDAIKSLLGKTDITYEVDSDVPTDTKVSLKADNILLVTAINVLTESAGIGCIESRTRTVTDTDKVRADISKNHLHFTKKPTAPLGRRGSSMFMNLPGNVYSNLSGLDALKNLPNNTWFTSPDGAKKLGDALKGQNLSGVYSGAVENALKAYSTDKNVSPLLYNLNVSEERSTFTCPHCHQQVTLIKKHVAPKCPTCGRVFEKDWKFCPVDGAKRPDEPGEWKFCPHCGKAVS